MNITKRYFKAIIKEKSLELRTLKQKIKEIQRSNSYAGMEQSSLISKKLDMRYLFLSYGLIRGKTIEQIENKSKNPINLDILTNEIERHNQYIKAREALECPKELV